MNQLSRHKIADITFAYRNHALIEHLQRRGAALNNLDFVTVEKCEKAIDKDKKNHEVFEQWNVPESCFITFETDDAAELAAKCSEWNEKQTEDAKKHKILGSFPFKTEESTSEPTDIIW